MSPDPTSLAELSFSCPSPWIGMGLGHLCIPKPKACCIDSRHSEVFPNTLQRKQMWIRQQRFLLGSLWKWWYVSTSAPFAVIANLLVKKESTVATKEAVSSRPLAGGRGRASGMAIPDWLQQRRWNGFRLLGVAWTWNVLNVLSFSQSWLLDDRWAFWALVILVGCGRRRKVEMGLLLLLHGVKGGVLQESGNLKLASHLVTKTREPAVKGTKASERHHHLRNWNN